MTDDGSPAAAPLAKDDEEDDDWNEFRDHRKSIPIPNPQRKKHLLNVDDTGAGASHASSNSNSFSDDYTDNLSRSLEDLVGRFDETINKCFANKTSTSMDTNDIAPVQTRTTEQAMEECQIWWTLTGNFGNILPIDWSKTYTRQLLTKALHLNERCESPVSSGASSEDDIQNSLDMHTMIAEQLDTESCPTADEVINEIEQMLNFEDDPPDGASLHESQTIVDDVEVCPSLQGAVSSTDSAIGTLSTCSSFTASLLRERLTALNSENLESDLNQLSVATLNELYDEIELTIKELSEALVHDLALKDEMEFEKETKNRFISLLLSVQRKKRDRSGKKSKGADGTFLTTVIPYSPNERHSVDQLQVFIKILQAIDENSPTVPSLLTDYILKVLCPTK